MQNLGFVVMKIERNKRSGSIPCIICTHSAVFPNYNIHSDNNCFKCVLDYNTLFAPNCINQILILWSNPPTDKNWDSGAIRRPSQRNACPDPRAEDNFWEKWAWLIAQQLDPRNLTSCSPVACKYRTLGKCEGLFLSDMAAAAAYPHQSIELIGVQILHIQPRPQLTSFSVIKDEFILSLA